MNAAREALSRAVNRAIANGAPRIVEIPTMQLKLERLMRFHRQNVFADDSAAADRHERALKRLKRTATFRALCRDNAAHAEYLASERLLRQWA